MIMIKKKTFYPLDETHLSHGDTEVPAWDWLWGEFGDTNKTSGLALARWGL